MGSTGIYCKGAGEQAHSFGDLGSPTKKLKKLEEKPPFKKKSSVYGGLDPDPTCNSRMYLFCY